MTEVTNNLGRCTTLKWARTFTLGELALCLPLPLKEAGEVPCDPLLIEGVHGMLGGTVLDDSDTVDDTPERAPFVVTLPFPEPLHFGVCAKKEAIFFAVDCTA